MVVQSGGVFSSCSIRLNCRIPCHLFACHWIRIASIVLCFVLQRTPTNENNGGTEWRGIQQLLPKSLRGQCNLICDSFLGIQSRRHRVKYMFTVGRWCTLNDGWGGYHQSLFSFDMSSAALSLMVDLETQMWSSLGRLFFHPSGKG